MKGLKKLIRKIKQKKELSGISDRFVREVLLDYLKKSGIDNSKIPEISEDKKAEKLIVSRIRAELRTFAGRFRKKVEISEILRKNNAQDILKSHYSTCERLPHYEKLKKEIRKINPESVLDLGCGINPIAMSELFKGRGRKNRKYYAADINQSDLSLVEAYFRKKRIEGKVFFYNLKKISDDLPKAELCLIFKVFDVLESRGHKLAEKILLKVPCGKMIVSFSTKTLSGRPMNHPQRGWIERLLNRLGWKFKILRTKNEIFYFIEKPGRRL